LREGKPNKVITRELDIGESAVEMLVRRIFSSPRAPGPLVRNPTDPTSADNGDVRSDHKLAQGSNPVTRWMAANVAVAQDPPAPSNPPQEPTAERIDGIVAAIMAIGRALVVQDEP
jgi:hypothetical protein